MVKLPEKFGVMGNESLLSVGKPFNSISRFFLSFLSASIWRTSNFCQMLRNFMSVNANNDGSTSHRFSPKWNKCTFILLCFRLSKILFKLTNFLMEWNQLKQSLTDKIFPLNFYNPYHTTTRDYSFRCVPLPLGKPNTNLICFVFDQCSIAMFLT